MSVVALDNSEKTVRILGVDVNRLTMAETLARFDGFVESGEPHFVITADASGLAQAQHDPEHRALFARASLITPDSAGVLWAARRAGCPISERVSGVDLVEQVCARSVQTQHRIFFLGAAEGVAEQAAQRMRQRYPGCNIVGSRNGFFKPDEDMAVAAEVAQAKPDYLFVAMGIPRQEKFILATQSMIRAGVAIGIGGSFDVISGNVPRAPGVWQRLKMEWLWRLIQNPQKLPKVMWLPKFIWYVLRDKK